MSNSTAVTAAGGGARSLTLIVSALSSTCSAFVLFGISCTVEWAHLKRASRKPLPFIIGLASQLLFMPALTYSFAKAFELNDLLVFAFITIGCVPGGTTSNTLTYFAAADTALSVSLTSVTNLLALGTLPLLLYLWTSSSGVRFKVPFQSIVISLAVILLPATFGVWLRAKRPRWARVGEKVGAILGAIVIVLTVVVSITSNMDALRRLHEIVPPAAWAAVALCAPCGTLLALFALCLAWSIARVCACRSAGLLSGPRSPPRSVEAGKSDLSVSSTACTTSGGVVDGIANVTIEVDAPAGASQVPSGPTGGPQQWVTVLLETGVQNMPLALAVINVTLLSAQPPVPLDSVLATQIMVAMWTILTTAVGTVVVFVSRWCQGMSLFCRDGVLQRQRHFVGQ